MFDINKQVLIDIKKALENQPKAAGSKTRVVLMSCSTCQGSCRNVCKNMCKASCSGVGH